MATPLRMQSLTPALSLGVAAALATAIILTSDRPAAPRDTAPTPEPPTICMQRTVAREAIARDVAAGRMPLARAVAVFARLNDLPPRASLPPEPMVTEAARYGVAVGTGSSAGEAVWLQTMLWALRQAGRDGTGQPSGELPQSLASEYWAARSAGRLNLLPSVDEPAYQRLMEESEKITRRLTGPRLLPDVTE